MIPKWALKKAIEMFGPKATVKKDKCYFFKSIPEKRPMCSGVGAHPQPCQGALPLYTIGRVMLGLFNEVKGQGMTWKEAFVRAEKEKHRDSCRRCVRQLPCKALRILSEKADELREKELSRRGLFVSISER